MKIIIPMAGLGTRMRPHTLTVKKPLIPIAGKTIVQRLVEEIASVINQPVEEIAYVIGRFGEEVESELRSIASKIGAKASIYYQDIAMGTGHAVWCASPSLNGPLVVAFADTLFYAGFKFDASTDGTIWVQKVKTPESFGVVTLDNNNIINGFVEKPKSFVSDLAIIGIYYFNDGLNLQKELQRLIDENIKGNNEYQLTDALENMRRNGMKFIPGEVDEWLDCGNKDATVLTNQRILAHEKESLTQVENNNIINSVIIQPCYLGHDVKIENSVIGPYVSVGRNTVISNCIIKNSIIQNNSQLNGAFLHNSMIVNDVIIDKRPDDLSVGDFNQIRKNS